MLSPYSDYVYKWWAILPGLHLHSTHSVTSFCWYYLENLVVKHRSEYIDVDADNIKMDLKKQSDRYGLDSSGSE
jgi:hypothetical protein